MSAIRTLVTGAAGFIGSHVAARLADAGHEVVGCDNFNDYYDPRLKEERVEHLLTPRNVACRRVELADAQAVADIFDSVRPEIVIHLAAQAGVRHSITQPQIYVQSNVVAFGHLLEACVRAGAKHLVYASSSSVYGASDNTPFDEGQRTDHPISLYAATKKANELMAHCYSHIHGLRATGLRFFTVYGPWGRPDMACFMFAEKILAGHALPIFASGKLMRDFTYIDDIVEGVVRMAASDADDNAGRAEIFNIGNHQPVSVLEFVGLLSAALRREARLEFLPMQPGDVYVTSANVDRLRERIGFEPNTPLAAGLEAFVRWFLDWKARRSGTDGC